MTNLSIFHTNIEKRLKEVGVDSKFTITKESSIKLPKVVLLVSVFRIPDPYKNESLYTNGLSMLLDNLEKCIKNCVLRIYYDDSILKKDNKWKHIVDKAQSKLFTEMVHYEFPQFKKKNSFYHEGLLGTMVRFFPLFNFSDINEAISILDIDFEKISEVIEMTDVIKKSLRIMKSTKTSFMFNAYSIMAYFNKPRLLISDIIKKYDFTTRMVVQPTTCIKKLNASIICNFMQCMLIKCPLYSNWISGIMKGIDCKNVSRYNIKRKKQCEHLREADRNDVAIFAFGIDELFLNTEILEEFLKNKHQFLLFYQMPNFTHYHFSLYKRFQNRKISIKFMFEMYHALLGRKLKSTGEIYDAFKEVDQIIYKNEGKGGITLQTPQAKKIYEKFYKFLKSKVDWLLSHSDLEIYEIMMYKYLKNTEEKDFIIEKKIYKVKYAAEKEYVLVRCD